tara:strand:- start:1157 stop:1894 length:738 start_codon:yes stop_codon:yes gene_type:complete
MARTDIAGLLTGIPSGRPDPMGMGGNSSQQRLAFGAQRAEGLQRGVRGMMGQDPNTSAEKLQVAMSQLNMNDPADLKKLAGIQQATGDLTGAAKTVAGIAALAKDNSTRQMLISRAEKMGKPDIVAYLQGGGDIGPAMTILFRTPPAQRPANLTAVDMKQMNAVLKSLVPEESGFWSIKTGSNKNEKLLLFTRVSEAMAANPDLSMEDAMSAVLGLSTGGGGSSGGTVPQAADEYGEGYDIAGDE